MVRSDVVPTGIIRLFSANLSNSALLTKNLSVCILWPLAVTLFTGLNVPVPICNVTCALPIFFLSRPLSILSVKWKPAVGAATDPLFFEYIVWYLLLSISSESLFRYGGIGVSPVVSSISLNEISLLFHENLISCSPSFSPIRSANSLNSNSFVVIILVNTCFFHFRRLPTMHLHVTV
ncbi:hypothetical protein ES708_15150 [subsurface metagenome]